MNNSIEPDRRKVQRFVTNRFTHEDPEKLMKERGANPEEYISKHLSAEYVPQKLNKIYETELDLAWKAMQRGYEFVSNLDYTPKCIVARGWTIKLFT